MAINISIAMAKIIPQKAPRSATSPVIKRVVK